MDKTPAVDWGEGHLAFDNGLSDSANPYVFDGAPRKFWQMGYEYAKLLANKDKANAEPLERVPDKPIEQGKNAYIKGYPLSYNPYGPGDFHGTPAEKQAYQDYQDWRYGWHVAKNDAAAKKESSIELNIDASEAAKELGAIADRIETAMQGAANAESIFAIGAKTPDGAAFEIRVDQTKGFVGFHIEADKPTGGHNNYWRVQIAHPTREGVEPYTAEFEDIARALKLTPSEYNEAKAIWRTAGARLGNGKAGVTALYDAQKRVHYAKLDLADYER